MALGFAIGGCAHEKANGRSWVRDVHFHGTHHVKSSDILDHISLTETSWIPFSPKHYLDPLDLQIDRQRITAYYRTVGYFNAHVTEMSTKPKPKGSVDVDITIEEGAPTHVTQVLVEGLESLSTKDRDRVIKRLPLKAGERYDETKYLAAKQVIEERLERQGRAFATVEGEAQVDRDANTCVVVFHAKPGEVSHYGRVIVHGADEKLVTWRTTIYSGRRFDPRDIEQTRERLNKTGVYASVRVKPVERNGATEIADIDIEVTPGPRNELKVGVGVGFDGERQSVNLPVTYTRYGFLGGYRRLDLRLVPGWAVLPTLWNIQKQGPLLTVDATLTQPDFLFRDLEAKLNAGYDLGVDYAFDYRGPRGSAGLEYRFWRERVVVGASYHFQFLQFTNLTAPDVFNSPDQAKRFVGYTNPYFLAYLQEHIGLDLRDNNIEPHYGAYFLIDFEEGATWLGGSFTYQKVTPDVRFYIPLHRRVVIAQRFMYGKFLSSGDTPITQRYYLGGSDTHRGFNYDRLSPFVASQAGILVPIGGNTEALSQSEARIDLLQFKGSWLGLTAFFDAGDVPEAGRSLDLAQLHLATGAGLRYLTPIGVVRLDVGYRLNRTSAMQPDGRSNPDPGSHFAFHLSIGEPF